MANRKGTSGLTLALGGTATVHCVHDRIKREVTTVKQVKVLGAMRGHIMGKDDKCDCGVFHLIKECTCCSNLFVDQFEAPAFCIPCRGKPVHALAGPLPEPKGVIG